MLTIASILVFCMSVLQLHMLATGYINALEGIAYINAWRTSVPLCLTNRTCWTCIIIVFAVITIKHRFDVCFPMFVLLLLLLLTENVDYWLSIVKCNWSSFWQNFSVLLWNFVDILLVSSWLWCWLQLISAWPIIRTYNIKWRQFWQLI